MNKTWLIGRLTKDPELMETKSGASVCNFSIAVDRNYGEDKQTDFFNITAWRGLGETIAKYSHKGDKVSVVGSIQLRSYEDNKGNKHTTVDVIAQEVEFLSSKPKQTDEQPTSKEKKQIKMLSFDDDSDIPF